MAQQQSEERFQLPRISAQEKGERFPDIRVRLDVPISSIERAQRMNSTITSSFKLFAPFFFRTSVPDRNHEM